MSEWTKVDWENECGNRALHRNNRNGNPLMGRDADVITVEKIGRVCIEIGDRYGEASSLIHVSAELLAELLIKEGYAAPLPKVDK